MLIDGTHWLSGPDGGVHPHLVVLTSDLAGILTVHRDFTLDLTSVFCLDLMGFSKFTSNGGLFTHTGQDRWRRGKLGNGVMEKP